MPLDRFPKKDLRPHSCVSDDPHSLTETRTDVFSCAQSLELIRDSTGGLNVLAWDGEKFVEASTTDADGACSSPSLDLSIARAITLPTTAVDYGTTQQLFGSVQEPFASFGFENDASLAATHFAFSTLFPECLPAAPCFLITGPRPEARLFLDLLSSVVRHGLPLGQISRATFCSLPMELQPTLTRKSSRTTGPICGAW
jgi:hypothetical protein